MDTPQVIEQVTDASENPRDTDTESLLAQEFDRMDSEETGEINEQEGSAESEIRSEQNAEEATETGEADQIQNEEVQTVQADEEQQSAEQSGYTEPAPERWPDELRNAYESLAPEQRKLLMDGVYKPMQRQYTKSTQELADMRKSVDPYVKSLDHYRNDFERMGVNPEQAFQTQIAWAAHFARVGPEQGLNDMRDAYGLNKNDAQGKTTEEYLTPTERQMRTEIDGLRKQVAQTSDQTNNWQEQQRLNAANDHQNGVRGELESFISEQKDGKPLHPHVERVAPAIAGIIRGGLIKNVDDYGQPVPIKIQMAQAYSMAVKLDPSISNATPNPRQVTVVKNALAADVVANNPGGQGDVPKLSIADQLEENYDKLSSRVG
jgi:hypothetical protein